ncbi:MAG TPA: TIGR03618 family F420-dependent PPOX class oxidoreductase [Solirubrobacteraceae bacterium]|nr:TIGR03618 family F420-dependent PPOX class oxidoreductase [Solirubrobacteraceae bacterium]
MAAVLEQRTIDLLRRPNFATLSTLRPNGTILGVVLWLGIDEAGTITLNSAEGRAWPASVRRDPRVTLTVPNHEDPYEFVSITGRVVADTHDGADAHIDALAKKYLGVDSYPYRREGEQRIIFTVEPDRVFHRGG